MSASLKKKFCIALFFVTLLILPSFLRVNAYANSAQSHWHGTTSFGTAVKEQNCPIRVEHETLKFHIDEFPKTDYGSEEEFLRYDGRVTADYTFYNPADYSVRATLVFPFGKMPYYGDRFEGGLASEYSVTADGAAVDVVLRHTYSGSSFEIKKSLAQLQDNYRSDPFFAPDLKVTAYEYTVSGIEVFTTAYGAIDVGKRDDKTRYSLSKVNGVHANRGHYTVGAYLFNGNQITVYAIGEPPDETPVLTLYDNGSSKKTIGGIAKITDVHTMTFEDFIFMSYPHQEKVSRTDWYNAVLDYLNAGNDDCAYVGSPETDRNWIVNNLMQWYEYQIDIGAGESLENIVTAPLYPYIDLGSYSSAVYGYQYLLSPASTWADFGTLEIEIETPYFIVGRDDRFTKTDTSYRCSYQALPDGELDFLLSADENPAKITDRNRNTRAQNFVIAFIGIVVASVICAVTVIVVSTRQPKIKKK